MKTTTQTRATPAILSYLSTSTTHDGKPHSRIACVLLMNGQDAERLLERWNLEGKRTGHTYTCQNITHYSGSIKETQWLQTVNSINYAPVSCAA